MLSMMFSISRVVEDNNVALVDLGIELNLPIRGNAHVLRLDLLPIDRDLKNIRRGDLVNLLIFLSNEVNNV